MRQSPQSPSQSELFVPPMPLVDVTPSSLAANESIRRRERRLLRNLLLFVCFYQPLWLLAAVWQVGGSEDEALAGVAVLRTLLAWTCMAAVYWRGLYRRAAAVFVVGQLSLTFFVYARWGLHTQAPYQLLQLLPVLLAGQLLGRRALWGATALLATCLIAGAVHDIQIARPLGLTLMSTLHMIVGAVIVSTVLDAALGQLRRSLRTARRQAEALAATGQRLTREIREKELALEQLVHAQKLEALGQLASGVAHDFNHLLALVQSYARQGLGSQDPAQMHAALQGVDSAALRAVAASRRLLDFSRAGPAQVEVFEVGACLRGLEPTLRQLLGQGVALVIVVEETTPSQVFFDRQQLELIVLNLASNAESAMEGQGRFMLELEVRSGADGQGQVLIRASDTGSGMSEEVLARCFEPFFTTKPVGTGTGLGLPVARTLLEEAGGSIQVSSAPGQGSCFTLSLPLHDTAQTPAAASPAAVA